MSDQNYQAMSPREAVCQYMGWEFTEAADYRYHYGRTSAPVYSTNEGVVCATANDKHPPNKKDFAWKEAGGGIADYCKSRGKTIWVAGDNA